MTNDLESLSFVLHVRPYTDSRLLVELFDQTLGRCTAVARVSKKQARSGFEPFQVLAVVFGGRRELKSLYSAEAVAERRYRLSGRLSFCGLYLNELLMRLLPVLQPNVAIFKAYESCLAQLALTSELSATEPSLRKFEFTLISEMGYGINWWASADGLAIEANARYLFNGEEFVRDGQDGVGQVAEAQGVFPGWQLIALANGEYTDPEVRLSAKRLTRIVLDALLDGYALKSRELFK